MKPNELLRKKENYYGRRGHSDVESRLSRYEDKDCVVAYYKEKLGTIFIIKGKVKFFAFIYYNTDLYFGGYGYNLTNVKLNDAVNLMGNDAIIVDEELYGKMKKTMIVDAL